MVGGVVRTDKCGRRRDFDGAARIVRVEPSRIRAVSMLSHVESGQGPCTGQIRVPAPTVRSLPLPPGRLARLGFRRGYSRMR